MSNSEWFANDGKCDVCGKDTKIVVCASTMGPVSLAYCKDCLENRAEPYSIMTAYIACAGNWPDDFSPEYQARVLRLLVFHKKTEAEFSKDVADLHDEDMYD